MTGIGAVIFREQIAVVHRLVPAISLT